MIELIARVTTLRATNAQVEKYDQQEKSINDGRRGRIEIVVGASDKFADFVNKEPDADTAQGGGNIEDPAIGKDKRQEGCNKKEQTAPEKMGNVELATANLRISGHA